MNDKTTPAAAAADDPAIMLADLLAGLTPEQRAACDALAAKEAAIIAEYRANTSRTERYIIIQATIGKETIRLVDDVIDPSRISRSGMYAVAKAYGAASITVDDTTWTRGEHNYFGELPEKCLKSRKYCYLVRTDTLEVYDRGNLIYINAAGHIMRDDDLYRRAAECEFGA